MMSLQTSSNNQFKNKKIIVQMIGLLLGLIAFFIPIIYFFPTSQELQLSVRKLSLIQAFETSSFYMMLHIIVALPVLLLSFDSKVAFYKQWKYLFPAIFIVGAVFILWDVWFTKLAVWGFNDAYFLGLKLFALPFEEWMFFLTVPYACVFIYACINAYFPDAHKKINDRLFTFGFACISLCLAFANVGKIYTSTTMLLLGIGLICHYLLVPNTYRSKFFLMYLIALIPFTIINGALTGSFSKEPVVLYNQEEILGIRVFSIPMEDFFYCMLYLFFVIVLFEYFKKGNEAKL